MSIIQSEIKYQTFMYLFKERERERDVFTLSKGTPRKHVGKGSLFNIFSKEMPLRTNLWQDSLLELLRKVIPTQKLVKDYVIKSR